jgi:transcriptional regulator with PAS, ATPase and Fis domain
MLTINCAALPAALLESELFGHKAGSFTGAVNDRVGLFEQAAKGTAFLDEIGDVDGSIQVKLLRVLQEREILRIGENTPRRVDIRVIAATNIDLSTAVAKGRFRKDLLFRLRVVEIRVPRLADRHEDILVLCEHFISELSSRMQLPELRLHEECHPYLLNYSWPGNVRELYNVMERAAIFGHGKTIRMQHLPAELWSRRLEAEHDEACCPKSLREVEAEHIRKTLIHTGGNRPKAAKILGISQSTLWRKLKTSHQE